MAPAKKGNKVTKEVPATDENLHITRKRGRSATTAKEQPVIAKEDKKVNKKEDKEAATIIKEAIVDDLDVSTSASNTKDDVEEPVVVKRKRGRPPNGPNTISKKKEVKAIDPSAPKRGRGRPRKTVSAAV